MSNAKISIEHFDSQEQFLYTIDKTISLSANIENICQTCNLPKSTVFGLKYQPNKFCMKDYYISDDNFNEIQHSDCLKIVYSIRYIVDNIIKNIKDPNFTSTAFAYISQLGFDEAFIKELAATPVGNFLIDLFVYEDELTADDQLALLITILHLFNKGFINVTRQDILQKLIRMFNISDTSSEELRYVIAMMHKILSCKNTSFNSWKEQIIRQIQIVNLYPHIWNETNKNLQYNTLALINMMIRICKGEKKFVLIQEMSLSKNRENIYNSIIAKRSLDKNMEHELYVLQTYLLSLFNEALKNDIIINENDLFKRDEFDLCAEDMKRITVLMDFDDVNFQNHKYFSVENLLLNGIDRNSRISLASIKSNDTTKTPNKWNCSSRSSSIMEEEITSISYLTLEALRHYKKFHFKNFHQSQIEEKLYEPGIFATSERVIKMLAKLLHIGIETPDSKCTNYQPIVFNCSPKTPFLLELFSRTMWLLSQTRRDMKASTITDYPKVLNILEHQVRTALNTKPMDLKSLTTALSKTSFESVMDQIQKSKEEELTKLIKTHPCIQELKKHFADINTDVIFQQRIKFLLNGAHFPKVLEKKTQGSIYVKLSNNQRELLISDVIDVKTGETVFRENIKVADITHVVIGKNCGHANLCNNSNLAFSIIVDRIEKVKFIAKDEKSAAYWTDALLLLTNDYTTLLSSSKLSKYYTHELNDLILMDVKLKLLDLQNVTLPKEPPPVPPLPKELKPPLLPKPNLRKHKNVLE